MTSNGRLIAVSGPSGAGKTSLVKALSARDSLVRISVSVTTRAKRENEIDGIDYHFITRDEYRRLVANGAFLESAQVVGHYYGTLRSTVEEQIASGFDVICTIDWQGVVQIKETHPSCLTIFIATPSMAELEKRLRLRGQNSEESIKKRLLTAEIEMTKRYLYDFTIVNDDFSVALEQFAHIVTNTRATRASL